MKETEKERCYNEALERAKKLKETCDNNAVVGWMEYIFPELKESEGEKVRKMLIEFFSRGAECNSSTNGIPDKDIITWLEKQGEQKPADKIEQEYNCTGVREPKEATGVLKQLLNKENYAWSEEDKVKINRIVAFLENLNLKYLNAAGNDILLKDIEWLKSLKERYLWKPSEEQMDALETAVSSLQSTALESLYQDLKKL